MEEPDHAIAFELVVHSNVVHLTDPQQLQQGILISNDLPLVLEAQFKSPPKAGATKVLLQYVVVCHENGSTAGVWIQKQLGFLTWPTMQRIEVPAKQLTSTYHAIAATKKLEDALASFTFHTYFRAEVACGASEAQPYHAYSPEVYVCGDRNIRRIFNPKEMCR